MKLKYTWVPGTYERCIKDNMPHTHKRLSHLLSTCKLVLCSTHKRISHLLSTCKLVLCSYSCTAISYEFSLGCLGPRRDLQIGGGPGSGLSLPKLENPGQGPRTRKRMLFNILSIHWGAPPPRIPEIVGLRPPRLTDLYRKSYTNRLI